MKLIIAIVQPEELPEIKEELLKRKIYKFTVSNALGQGKEIPIQEVYRGIAHEITLLKKVRLEIAVNNDYVDAAVEAICKVANKYQEKKVEVKFLFCQLKNVFVSELTKKAKMLLDKIFI